MEILLFTLKCLKPCLSVIIITIKIPTASKYEAELSGDLKDATQPDFGTQGESYKPKSNFLRLAKVGSYLLL